jgi:hypothetical protein
MRGYCSRQRKVVHFKKDPSSVLNYTFDWTEWLLKRESTIFSADVTVNRGDIVLENFTVETLKVHARVSGGTVPRFCELTCRITTNSGEIEERTMFFKIDER